MNISVYAKSIVMIIAAGIAILGSALTDNLVTPIEYVNIAIAMVTAIGVYLIPNLPAGPAKFGKTIVALAGASLMTLAVVLGTALSWGAVTSSDWIAVVLAGLAAIGIYIIPNGAPVNQVVVVKQDSLEVEAATLAANKV